MKRYGFYFLCLCSALYGSLTLDQAVDIVKKSNLEIEVAKQKILSASQKVKEISGKNFGSLELTQTVMRSDDAGNAFGFKLARREASFADFGFDEFLAQMPNLMSGQDPNAGAKTLAIEPDKLNYPDAENYFQTKLTYKIPLYTGGQLSSYEKLLKKMEEFAQLDVESVIREKVFEVKKSFYNMALLEATISHLNTILENLQTLENTVRSMMKEGYAKEIDLLEVQAKKSGVERMINQMKARKELLYHYLSFLLNQEVTDIEIVSEDVEMPNVSVDEVVKGNLDIQKAYLGREMSREMVNVEKSKYFPMVGAFAEIQTTDDTFLGDADDHKSWTIGARLTWNIFNGLTDKASVERAKVEALQRATQTELAKKGIILKYKKIMTEIANYSDEIARLEKEFQLADRIYQNYREYYRENLKSMNDVIIKQSQQIEKKLQLLQLKNKRNEAILELEKLYKGE